MIPTVTAHTALIQTVYWDVEKRELVANCIHALPDHRRRQHEIATRRLHRCIGQIATLEHWRESINEAQGATISATGYPRSGIGSKKAQVRNLGSSTTQNHFEGGIHDCGSVRA